MADVHPYEEVTIVFIANALELAPGGPTHTSRDDRITAALQRVIDLPPDSPTYGRDACRIGLGVIDGALSGELRPEEAAQAAREIFGVLEDWLNDHGLQAVAASHRPRSVRGPAWSGGRPARPADRRDLLIANAHAEWRALGRSFHALCGAEAYINQTLREKGLVLLSAVERSQIEHK